jgi:integrase
MKSPVRADGVRRNDKELKMAMKTGWDGAGRGSRGGKAGRYAALRALRLSRPLEPDLKYGEVGAFLQDLRQEPDMGARALAFMFLTVCRVEEASWATWDEFDFEARVWTIPAERTPGRKARRVPLSDETLEVLDKVHGYDPARVFPGIARRAGSHLAFRGLLKRLGLPVTAVRSARAAFRTWAEEWAQQPRTIVGLCLGHEVVDPASGALPYRRLDRFDRCRALMADWARWCNTVQPGA